MHKMIFVFKSKLSLSYPSLIQTNSMNSQKEESVINSTFWETEKESIQSGMIKKVVLRVVKV